MKKLVDGVGEFRRNVFGTHREMFEKLAEGQQPLALFITCSDSRIVPSLVTQTSPGDLFIIRNAGNIVPPHGGDPGGEESTIEYAVSVLGIADIVVCGHSRCGAVTALLHPEQLSELPAVSGFLKHTEETMDVMREKFAHVTDDGQRLKTAVEQNVLVQLRNLRTHPCVQQAEESGRVKLHGWTYEFETGSIFAHDSGQDRFIALDEIGL